MKPTFCLMASILFCLVFSSCLQREKSQAPALDSKPIPDTAKLRQYPRPQIPDTKKKQDTLRPILALRD
ncbi:hypothetical protein [Robiginitalea sp. IMCC43444]|uniref:hypothetical protein n=1 Tax=Robiginitalea sp. IMCC43444 TaxID=3459121 RepID=UPI0040417EB7